MTTPRNLNAKIRWMRFWIGSLLPDPENAGIAAIARTSRLISGQVDVDPEAVDLEEVFARHSHMEEDFVDVKGQDYAKGGPAHRRRGFT